MPLLLPPHPNTGADVTAALQTWLDQAARTPGATLKLPPGTYLLRPEHASIRAHAQSNTGPVPERHYGLLLEKHQGTTIEAEGVTLLCHGAMSAIGLIECEDIKIKGLTIDWGRLITTEAVVEKIETDGTQIICIDTANYPVRVQNGKLCGLVEGVADEVWSSMLIDPATGRNLGDTWESAPAEDLGDGRFRVKGFFRAEHEGQILVLRHHLRSHAGVFAEGGRNLSFEDIRLYATCGLGFLFQQVENVTFSHVEVRARPGRYAGPKDDAFHFSGVRGKVVIEHCHVSETPDDPVNVHGTCLPVVRQIASDTVIAHFSHHESPGQRLWARPGDTIAINDRPTLLTRHQATVKIFRLLNERDAEIVFTEPLKATLTTEIALENLSTCPDVEIRRCRMGHNRARGILMSTSGKVVIEHNHFTTQGSAILIPGDANGWFESGAVRDVTIRHNLFDNCLLCPTQFSEAIISIYPETHRREAGRYFHHNIRISGNSFKVFDAPILYADNTENLVFENNQIERTHFRAAWHPRKDAITLIHCADVSIKGNEITGTEGLLSRVIAVDDMAVSEIKFTGDAVFTGKK